MKDLPRFSLDGTGSISGMRHLLELVTTCCRNRVELCSNISIVEVLFWEGSVPRLRNTLVSGGLNEKGPGGKEFKGSILQKIFIIF